MKVLIYTCLDIFNSNPLYIETLEMCLKQLFKTQDYEFDYMLNVGYSDIRIYRNRLAKYRNRIIFKQHKDFEYYNKFKDVLSREWMIWYSKVFMAREIKGYDVLIHNDYDNIPLKSYKPLIDITCNYDVLSYSHDMEYDRLGTEFIFFNGNSTNKLRIEDLEQFNTMNEERLLWLLKLNTLNIRETLYGTYEHMPCMHIHPFTARCIDYQFLQFVRKKIQEIAPKCSFIKNYYRSSLKC